MLGEVNKVLRVERGQRQALDQAAACGYPRVVDWPGPSAPLGTRLKQPTGCGHVLVRGSHANVALPIFRGRQACVVPSRGGRSIW
jgi:hypothetical protein